MRERTTIMSDEVETVLRPFPFEEVEHIISQFPFDKVHQYMVDTDWKWYNSNLVKEVPTIKNMMDQVRSLLYQLHDASNPCRSLASRGFVVDKIHQGFCLSFVPWSESYYLTDATIASNGAQRP
jgi:hypothetical protein